MGHGRSDETMEARCAHAASLRDCGVLGRQDPQLDQCVSVTPSLLQGSQVLGIGDPNDAFWLAQTYFMTNQYARAHRLLTRPFPTSTKPPAASHSVSPQETHSGLLFPTGGTSTPAHDSNSGASNGKGKNRESIANFLLGSDRDSQKEKGMPRLPLGAAGLVDVPEPLLENTSRLVDMSLACRYLAAQCMASQLFRFWQIHTLTGEFRFVQGNGRRLWS